MFDWVLNTPLIKSIYMIFVSVIKQFMEKEGGGGVGCICGGTMKNKNTFWKNIILKTTFFLFTWVASNG